MPQWRFILGKSYDAVTNMAIDEAIRDFVADKESPSPPTIRIYYWLGGGVSLGDDKNSNIVNVEACTRDGVGFVRRPTGGNAVYHHPDDPSYSIIAPTRMIYGGESGKRIDLVQAFDIARTCLVDAFRRLGLEARMVGKNDVVIGGQKVVGTAQKIRPQAALVHGTVFYRAHPDDWMRYLHLPEAPRIRGIVDLDIELDIEPHDLFQALKSAFVESSLVGGDYALGRLTEREERRAESLKATYLKSFAGTGNEEAAVPCITDIRDD